MAQRDLTSWIGKIKSNEDHDGKKPKTNDGPWTVDNHKNATEKKNDAKRGPPKSESIALKSTAQISSNDGTNSGRSKCEEERFRGNQYFAKGKFDNAIQCYTRCLGSKDALASAVVYSNRGE